MPRNPQPLISDQLRAALAGERRSLYQLAELAEVPRQSLSRFCAGKSGLTLDTMDRLAGVLGLRLVQGRRR